MLNKFLDVREQRDRYILVWVDPIEVLSNTGELRTGTQEYRISIQDAIDFQRRRVQIHLKERSLDVSAESLSDDDMLYDFIVHNCAEIRIGRIGE